MKKYLIFILLLLMPSMVLAGEYWVRIDLIPRPFFDKNGEILTSVEGLDYYYGGGKVYPDLSKYKIIARCEHNLNLLVKLDISNGELTSLINKNKALKVYSTYTVRNKRNRKPKHIPKRVMRYNFRDFNIRQITEVQALNLINQWGYEWP